MTYLITGILILIYYLKGACKGTCDSIEFHDAYKDKSRIWQRDSWKDKKVFGMVWNIWHRRDVSRNVLGVVAVALVILLPPELNLLMLIIPIAFQVGFWFNYK